MKLIMTIITSVTLLILAGCVTGRPGLTKCPRCGWLLEAVTSEQDHDAQGAYVVTWYRCFSMNCQWVGSSTNRLTAIPSPKNAAIR